MAVHRLSRQLVYGCRGMICSNSPLAASVGIKVLQEGGNAFDAALAVAAVETVAIVPACGLDAGSSPQPTGRHNDDRLYCSDGQGGVKGITAFLQDLDTDARRQGGVRTNHTTATIDKLPRQA